MLRMKIVRCTVPPLFLHICFEMMQHPFIRFHYFRGLLLVSLYTLFFSVELLHNFDSEKSVKQASFRVEQLPNTSIAKPAKRRQEVQFKVRLNKRFQPSYIPSPIVVTTRIFSVNNDRERPTNYCDEPVLDLSLLTKSLRAPPVVSIVTI